MRLVRRYAGPRTLSQSMISTSPDQCAADASGASCATNAEARGSDASSEARRDVDGTSSSRSLPPARIHASSSRASSSPSWTDNNASAIASASPSLAVS